MSMTQRLAFLLGALATAATALAGENIIEKKFPLSANGALQINVDGAEVTVRGEDRDSVAIRAIVKGPASFVDRYEWTFDTEANRVTIRGEAPGKRGLSWGSWGARKVYLEVTAPRQLTAEIKTSGGDIDVKRLAGNLALKTSGGDVSLASLVGPVTAKTSGGSITVRDTSGPTRLATSGGNIEARDGLGNIEAKTSGGHITLSGIEGAIYAKTSGGNISIELQGGNQGLEARTSGGSIRLRAPDSLAGDLYAKTSGGSVTCNFPVTIRGKLKKNLIDGQLNGGGAAITLATSGGDIRISKL